MKFLDMFVNQTLEFICENKVTLSDTPFHLVSELWVTFPQSTTMEGEISLKSGFKLWNVSLWSKTELEDQAVLLPKVYKKPTIVFEEDGSFSINMLAQTHIFPLFAMYDSVITLEVPSKCLVRVGGYKVKHIFHRYLWDIAPIRRECPWWTIRFITHILECTGTKDNALPFWDTCEWGYNVVGYFIRMKKIKGIQAEIKMEAGSSKEYTVDQRTEEYNAEAGGYFIWFSSIPRVSTCKLECITEEPQKDIYLFQIQDARLLVGDEMVGLLRYF